MSKYNLIIPHFRNSLSCVTSFNTLHSTFLKIIHDAEEMTKEYFDIQYSCIRLFDIQKKEPRFPEAPTVIKKASFMIIVPRSYS
jgi:hypothetical protein